MFEERFEVGQFGVSRLHAGRGHGEELAPVRPRLEGLQLGLDERQDFADLGPLRFPGEVNGQRGALVSHAHPQMVGRNGAQFGDEQVGRDVVAQLLDGQNRLVAAAEGNEILGLQLSAAGRREVHAEVRQALIPRAGNDLLLGTTLRIMPGQRVELLRGELGAEEILRPVVERARSEAPLDPDLRGLVVLPVSKQTDAVAA